MISFIERWYFMSIRNEIEGIARLVVQNNEQFKTADDLTKDIIIHVLTDFSLAMITRFAVEKGKGLLWQQEQ